MPRIAGERLPATYINHYTANGGAVVPQFGFNAAGTDERALEDISKAYNGERKVRDVVRFVHVVSHLMLQKGPISSQVHRLRPWSLQMLYHAAYLIELQSRTGWRQHRRFRHPTC